MLEEARLDEARPAPRRAPVLPFTTEVGVPETDHAVLAAPSPQAVCVARGDGIGPEIVDATLQVLEESGARLDVQMVEMRADAGPPDAEPGIPEPTWGAVRRTGVLLKGPLASSSGAAQASSNVALRKALGLFANVRPVRSYAPYVATNHPSMDLVVIRENEEDLHAGVEHRQTDDVAHCLKLTSRPGCERLLRYAFEYTRSRQRGKLTCMVKDDVMRLTDGLFREVFDEVAAEYPDVRTEHLLANVGIARVAAQPERFDVIVAPNLYGDILSGVAAEVSGSVGMAGAANIGSQCAVFEAVHGSAPDIAGLDVANPSGLMLAAVKMLAHVGQGDAAERMHNAWLRTIEDGVHTIDVYRDGRSSRLVGTTAFAAAVVHRLGERPARLRGAAYPRVPTRVPVLEPRPPARKRTVGVDVLLQWRGEVDELALRLGEAATGSFALTGISNRGVTVWPMGFPETLCADHWRARFTLPAGEEIGRGDVIALLASLDRHGVEFVQVETLCEFDGERTFTGAALP